MNKINLVIAFLLASVISVAQDASGRIPKKDIDRLNEKVIQHYRKHPKRHPQYDTVRTIDVFSVKYDDTIGLTMERLKNEDFLKHIVPCYMHGYFYVFNQRINNPFDNFLSSDVFLATESGKGILWFSHMDNDYCRINKNDSDEAFIKFVLENDIVSSYCIEGMDARYVICVNKTKQVYVVLKGPHSIKAWMVENFLDDEWPYLFNVDEYGRSENGTTR